MVSTSLTTCLIANRGEIAVRIIRACRELGIRAIAVYSEADAHARHVQLADEAYLLGPANPAASYLNVSRLLEVAQETGCDCVHPGYGFLSESEHFAQAVIAAGLTWVGPGPDAIRLMGVKTEARALMSQAGVPLVPGFQSESADDADFLEAAQSIGYPVMVKAAGGGGGKGFVSSIPRTNFWNHWLPPGMKRNTLFGDDRVFLEKYIESARHVEIQVLGDTHGHVIHLYERECSAQRRHQKIIEESPSPLLTEVTRQRMGQAAVEAAKAVNYVNAGTVEFIATPDGDFYFLEMNTRLQVEHPVTELVTGLDIVKLQFAVAAGESLPVTQADIRQRGHAVECRIYAEDPRNNFLPAVGPVLRFILPEGPGIRVDSGIQSGDEITIHYDPMIAKVITYDTTREAAVRRMQDALKQTVILGTIDNIAFLQALLAHPTFQAGEVDTRFVDANLETLLPEQETLPDIALLAAALTDMHPANTGTVVLEAGADGDAYTPWGRSDGFRMGR